MDSDLNENLVAELQHSLYFPSFALYYRPISQENVIPSDVNREQLLRNSIKTLKDIRKKLKSKSDQAALYTQIVSSEINFQNADKGRSFTYFRGSKGSKGDELSSKFLIPISSWPKFSHYRQLQSVRCGTLRRQNSKIFTIIVQTMTQLLIQPLEPT